MSIALKSLRCLKQICINVKAPQNSNYLISRYVLATLFSSTSYWQRVNRRNLAASKLTLDEFQFRRAVSQLLPRFKPEDLHNLINLQEDPLVCLELFNWASQQPRFTHDVSTFHVTIKKLGAAKMYDEMDLIVNEALAIPSFGSEALYNTMIYFFTEARKLSRAVNVYKHMRSLKKLDCKPSIRTYNLLFTSFLSRRSNTYINHMYMDTMSMLFKQMVDDGIDPDIFALNSMIKGYVLSLHVNDALRLYHQMGVVYDCVPNSFTFDYLIHGLCSQGRTCNARKICDEMKAKGFVPSSKSYNSLVSSFALEGEIDESVSYLWEMIGNERLGDYITYRTVVDELCRQQRCGDAVNLLKELQEKSAKITVGCVDAIAKRDGRVRRINNEKLGEAHFDQRTDCVEA
ncbi:unnamed protein product [Lactuca virosa]|uniref:Pentacotripeptide-repeat region of PRORP domain-containing protein n=1 Tax=Lactuca virosa TaxID=75947 RepID=A0AAU9NJE8_9ASTR|nr:unnamed protein product [Lactuca virosa]